MLVGDLGKWRMLPLERTLMAIINQMELTAAVSVIAGVIGAMLGLGGGILLVPIFTLLFHIPFRLAVGASTRP